MPFCGLSSNSKLLTLGIALVVAFCLPATQSTVCGMWQSAAGSSDSSSDFRPMVSDLSMGNRVDRVLMLQNGAVFSGKIEKQDGKWKIDLANHATLYFQNHQVRVVADSIQDIYLFQSQKTSQFDVQQKTAMVRWCLKNKLLPEAERELSELSRLRINPDLKRSLEVQLTALRDPTATALPSIANAAALRPQKNTSESQTLTLSPIVFAEAQPQKTITGSMPTQETTNPRSLPVASVFKVYDVPGMKNSVAIQDAIDRQLSDAALQTFSHSTHQVLVEACGACHFQGNSEIRSDVGFELQLASADSTEAIRHNLQQVLNLLNRENPGNSELLSIASNPHGGMKRPPVAAESPAQKSLMNWVFSTRIGDANLPAGNLESRVQLAGAEVATPASAATGSELGRLTPTVNPVNPYDPTAFNQQQSMDRYQLPSPTVQPLQHSGSAFPPTAFSSDNNALPAPNLTAAAPEGGSEHESPLSSSASALPRPTSMFSLRSVPESKRLNRPQGAGSGTNGLNSGDSAAIDSQQSNSNRTQEKSRDEAK